MSKNNYIYHPILLDMESEAGDIKKPNEDLVIALDSLFVVLDGATGLGEKLIDNYSSDACWFVNTVRDSLIESWNKEPDFIGAITEAVHFATSEFEQITSKSNIPIYELPSAGMVAVALEGNEVNLYRSGDCSIYYSSDCGTKKIFKNSYLEELDDMSIKEMSKYLEEGKSLEDSREAIKDTLQSNRSMMNTPDGYSALSVDNNCIQYIDKVTLPAEKEAKLLLLTDGFSSIIDKYKVHTAQSLFSELEKISAKDVIKKIRHIENMDDQLCEYPRLKKHDDASAIYMSF